MIALQITDIKTFMNQLLCSELFDHFLLSEASIAKDASFTIDGHLNPGFYSRDELETQGLKDGGILPYATLRPICYQLIKGSHTPVSFKFILLLSPENTSNVLTRSCSSFTLDDIQGIFLNIAYQRGQLMLTTGISYSIFSTDLILNQEWDALLQKFLNKNNVPYEKLS